MSNAPPPSRARSLRFTVGAMLLATPVALSCEKKYVNSGPAEPPSVNEGPQAEPPDETPDAPDETPPQEQPGGTTEPPTPDRPVVTSINPGPQTPPKPAPKVMVNPGPTSPPPSTGNPKI